MKCENHQNMSLKTSTEVENITVDDLTSNDGQINGWMKVCLEKLKEEIMKCQYIESIDSFKNQMTGNMI